MSIDIVDLDHAAFRVTDLEESLAFYRDLLGMRVRDRDRYEAGDVPYVAVAAGGRHLHLVPTDADDIDPTADSGAVPLGGDHSGYSAEAHPFTGGRKRVSSGEQSTEHSSADSQALLKNVNK